MHPQCCCSQWAATWVHPDPPAVLWAQLIPPQCPISHSFVENTAWEKVHEKCWLRSQRKSARELPQGSVWVLNCKEHFVSEDVDENTYVSFHLRFPFSFRSQKPIRAARAETHCSSYQCNVFSINVFDFLTLCVFNLWFRASQLFNLFIML